MFNRIQGNACSQPSDDRLSGARDIGVLNGRKILKGFVGLGDRTDYYSFRLTGHSRLNLSLNKLQNNADISLFRGRKVLSRSAREGKKPEAINASLEAGTYHIRVNQKSSNSKYQLTLNAAPAPAPPPPPVPIVQRLVSFFTSGGAKNSGLGLIDLNTGNLSQLPPGNMEGTILMDIATLGNDTFAVAEPNNLYRIDPSTSTYTFVSHLVSTNKTTINSLGLTSSGMLYAAGSKGHFYSIDTQTGKATLITRIPRFSSSGDLAYDPISNRFFATSRNLNASDSLYSIGLEGDAQLIGDIGFSNVWGLLREGGSLYGYTPKQQIKINLKTGAGTLDKTVPLNRNIIGISGAA